jgi:hypothetical protein
MRSEAASTQLTDQKIGETYSEEQRHIREINVDALSAPRMVDVPPLCEAHFDANLACSQEEGIDFMN